VPGAGLGAPGRVGGEMRHVADADARPDDVVRGPATIALADATVLVPPGWTARALAVGGWMLEA
jgi:N-methylhydantoinase A/oxoprolinase/acetone carboxylase beta subunit